LLKICFTSCSPGKYCRLRVWLYRINRDSPPRGVLVVCMDEFSRNGTGVPGVAHTGRHFQTRKIAMKARTTIALAAAALLAGISAASAAPAENGKMAPPPASTKMAPPARDTLTLTSAQRKKAWDDLYTGTLNQKTPSGFEATVGAALPSTVVSAPVTARAAGDVPPLKPYKFAMVQKKLVIVNPSDGKIVDVITR
jgi:hypothetical protein